MGWMWVGSGRWPWCVGALAGWEVVHGARVCCSRKGRPGTSVVITRLLLRSRSALDASNLGDENYSLYCADLSCSFVLVLAMY